MSNNHITDLDNIDVWTIRCTNISKGSFLLSPQTGGLDILNARINVSNAPNGNSVSSYDTPELLKSYIIGDGLTAVEGTKLRWDIDMAADNLGNHENLVFDGYVTNLDSQRRNFRGIFKINKVIPWT